jgi:hypothetical protein
MIILLALMFSAGNAFSKITLLEDILPKFLRDHKTNGPNEAQETKKVSKKSLTSMEVGLLKKIHAENEKINQYIKEQSTQPVIWDGSRKIETAKVFKGLLLNSVVSTNLESPLLVQVFRDQDLPVGTKFSCKGITSNKRVLTYCDRMITPTKEVPVKVQILNTDGSAGLRGIYNDGKDSYIAGTVLSDLGRGIISASTSKISTPIGTMNDISEKNKILEGLANSAKTTSDVLQDDMKSQEPKVFIEAGKPVLIYFMEGLDAY